MINANDEMGIVLRDGDRRGLRFATCLASLIELVDGGAVTTPLLEAQTGPWEDRHAQAISSASAAPGGS
jgi:hypothetical protein